MQWRLSLICLTTCSFCRTEREGTSWKGLTRRIHQCQHNCKTRWLDGWSLESDPQGSMLREKMISSGYDKSPCRKQQNKFKFSTLLKWRFTGLRVHSPLFRWAKRGVGSLTNIPTWFVRTQNITDFWFVRVNGNKITLARTNHHAVRNEAESWGLWSPSVWWWVLLDRHCSQWPQMRSSSTSFQSHASYLKFMLLGGGTVWLKMAL